MAKKRRQEGTVVEVQPHVDAVLSKKRKKQKKSAVEQQQRVEEQPPIVSVPAKKEKKQKLAARGKEDLPVEQLVDFSVPLKRQKTQKTAAAGKQEQMEEQPPVVSIPLKKQKIPKAAVVRTQGQPEEQPTEAPARMEGQKKQTTAKAGKKDHPQQGSVGRDEKATAEPQIDLGERNAARNGHTAVTVSKAKFRSKEKVLLLTSRGIPPRFRHLMLDLIQLLPHSKKDAKLDTKSDLQVINEVADMKGCNNVIFFETRKHKDLYIWAAKSPNGPSVKFHCTNVHTMAELKLSGNHLKGSRPVLCFSDAFNEQPHWQLIKEIFTHIFATPKGHPKTKPFLDHILNFAIVDDRIWVRNYQVVTMPDKKKVVKDSISLVEVGPRMTLNPIKVLSGSFEGPVLYSNPSYISPNLIRAEERRQKSGRYGAKLKGKERRKSHALANQLPVSELADIFKG